MIRHPQPLPGPSPAGADPRFRRRTYALVAAVAVLASTAIGAVLAGAAPAAAVVAPAAATPISTPSLAPSTVTPICPIIAPVPTSPPAITGPDSEPPTAPGKPAVEICGGALYVTWSLGTDNIGVQKWTLYRLVGDVVSTITTYAPGYRFSSWTSYEQFWVDAVDYAGNHSVKSPSASVGTPPSCSPPSICPTTSAPATTSGPDTQAPSTPSKPAIIQADGVVTLRWAASTDNVGVVSYEVRHQWTDIVEIVKVTAPTTVVAFAIGSSNTYHVFSVAALDAAGNRSPFSEPNSVGTPSTCQPVAGGCVPTSAPPVGTCAVTYTISSQWSGGFQATVQIRNTGSAPINPWTLGFAFPGGQQITQIWNATQTQSGTAVTVRNLDWNNVIAPGGSVSFGFLGSWAGTNGKPTAFTVNGASCQVA